MAFPLFIETATPPAGWVGSAKGYTDRAQLRKGTELEARPGDIDAARNLSPQAGRGSSELRGAVTLAHRDML